MSRSNLLEFMAFEAAWATYASQCGIVNRTDAKERLDAFSSGFSAGLKHAVERVEPYLRQIPVKEPENGK